MLYTPKCSKLYKPENTKIDLVLNMCIFFGKIHAFLHLYYHNQCIVDIRPVPILWIIL